ncbi:MAG: hypothetical protein ACPHRO_12455 [Nannocystaceae bacterium]
MKSPRDGLVPVERADVEWTGDGHALRLEAGEEVGLSRREVALDSFREGFSNGVELVGMNADLVLHGRTILSRDQLEDETRALLRRAGIPRRGVLISVDDGQFEIRISRSVVAVVGMTRPLAGGGGSVGVAAGLTVTGVALGLSGLPLSIPGALLAMAAAALMWRARAAKGRGLIAAYLTDELSRLAQRSGVILPPNWQRDP